MILLACPHCGPRNSSEFRHQGEARHAPPRASTGPEEWRDYLYTRRNPAGWATETWFHAAGCRRFLVVERHTVTNAVRSVGPPGGGETTG